MRIAARTDLLGKPLGHDEQCVCGECRAADRFKFVLAENARLTAEVERLRGDASHTPEYWQGHDAAVAGVAMRWEQALTAPIPTPGVMNEPLESLYCRTERLRADAGRYRWLRHAGDSLAWRLRYWDKRWNGLDGHQLDAILDAAIKEAGNG